MGKRSPARSPLKIMAANILNNRYRILQTLAEGGFGRTYLAEDTHMPSMRRCVIKQLKPIAQNAQTQQLVRERFQREGAVLEELGEHNRQIPRLYAYFSEGGEFYLVQEWIEGSTLTETVRHNGHLTEEQVTALLESLLPVLDFIHSRHIVHRDIKPDNIILRAADGVPMLIDFGAVKEAVNAPNTSARASIVIGTPGFIAPEQAAGHPAYASDLYSLGLTAVFALSGKFPQDLTADGRTGEILWRQDVSVSNRSLGAVLERAIRQSARDRFATARDMLAALQGATPNVASGSGGNRPSTMPTVAVSPGLPTQPNTPTPATSPTLPVASPNTPVPPASASNTVRAQPQRGCMPGCLLWGFVFGGLLGVGWAFGGEFVSSRFAPESPPSEPVSSQPAPDTSPPAVTPNPKPSPNPAPEFDASQPDTSQPDTSEPDEPANDPPEIATTPDPQTDPTPAEVEEVEAATSEPETPEANNPPASESNRGSTDVPGFAPGTQRSAIEFALGEPTRESSGLWNTQAVLYRDRIPGKVDLGYLFDPGSGRLRQTEATFDGSLEIDTLSATLEEMTSNNLSVKVEKGLTAVYRGKVDRFDFTSGRRDRLKGIIQRDEDDRIYIAVWEADLHE
ncbi:MAG: protein kinase [Cyanobacteriota bacterium]|nr:protein kinase [Cyanobacteriota bacterium]